MISLVGTQKYIKTKPKSDIIDVGEMMEVIIKRTLEKLEKEKEKSKTEITRKSLEDIQHLGKKQRRRLARIH